jgi:hypothetical protein
VAYDLDQIGPIEVRLPLSDELSQMLDDLTGAQCLGRCVVEERQ